MKKVIKAIAAAILSLAVATPALAASSANVVQAGDNQYSIVVQGANKTLVKSGVAASPGAQHQIDKMMSVLARQASRQGTPTTGKMGGARCRTGFGVENAGYVVQTGVGNSATTNQLGTGNTAGTIQNGIDNKSYIVQRGNGNEAFVTQEGNNNSSLVIQRC